jgi:zinc transporter
MSASKTVFDVACLLDGKGGARNLAVDEVREHIADEQILWVDLNLNNEDARRWLMRKSTMDKTIVQNLLAGETRPRALATGDGLLVVLRGVNLNPGADPEDMVAVRVWLQKNLIITSRRRRVL